MNLNNEQLKNLQLAMKYATSPLKELQENTRRALKLYNEQMAEITSTLKRVAPLLETAQKSQGLATENINFFLERYKESINILSTVQFPKVTVPENILAQFSTLSASIDELRPNFAQSEMISSLIVRRPEDIQAKSTITLDMLQKYLLWIFTAIIVPFLVNVASDSVQNDNDNKGNVTVILNVYNSCVEGLQPYIQQITNKSDLEESE